MDDVRSVLAGGTESTESIAESLLPGIYATFPRKFYWFAQHGYFPHTYQMLFHGAHTDGHLVPNRHLVAGRRGGKTLSAAWEVLYYALHPQDWHMDVHGEINHKPLWIWILTKDYPTGFASVQALLEIMRQVGMQIGKDFMYNKTNRHIEFPNGTLIQFKTADDPQSLRGAGLDILWMDEAAFIPTDEAYTVTSPALADKDGGIITTTTPHGKNWLFTTFFSGAVLRDEREFRVQYTSIDSPYFKRTVWERYKKRYHPILFKQEFLASFEAMHGIAMQGDWLHYWTAGRGDIAGDIASLQSLIGADGRYDLDTYIGVDPAISLSDTADHFAMAVLGLKKDRSQGYLLDTYKGRLPFPDQLSLIQEWLLKWSPMYIGIENNAFQAALAQQAARLDGFPNVVPVTARGKKNERILAMGPAFKIGKIRIHESQKDFVDEWVSFNPERKNQEDDVLDAVEIAMQMAGIIIPFTPHAALMDDDRPGGTDSADVSALVKKQLQALKDPQGPFDDEMGSDW